MLNDLITLQAYIVPARKGFQSALQMLVNAFEE